MSNHEFEIVMELFNFEGRGNNLFRIWCPV
jgi:hypothetical protein